MLARHEYVIGDFYYRQANFKASESRMAELVALYGETPIAPEALYDLARTLKKQGKRYSAAQAFTALKQHYPNTRYALIADSQLKKLHQPVDTEEDPLKVVLAESGFGEERPYADQVAVHESLANLDSTNPDYAPSELAKLAGSQAAAAGPTMAKSPASNNLSAGSNRAEPGPAILRMVRLSSAEPPLSVILDLSGPVNFDDKLKKGGDSSTLQVYLKGADADAGLARHLVFDRSIFRDCDIQPDAGGTSVTVTTTPVSRFAIVPLERPARLLITFTPLSAPSSGTASSGMGSGATF